MPVPHHKLVRDRIPDIIRSERRHPVTRVLDDHDYQAALLAKLAEEASEAARAPAQELPEEDLPRIRDIGQRKPGRQPPRIH